MVLTSQSTDAPCRRIIKAISPRDGVQGDEVLLRITHSSLCGTDEHYLGTDMCLGHEGADIVEKLGSNIQHIQT